MFALEKFYNEFRYTILFIVRFLDIIFRIQIVNVETLYS